MTFPINNVAKQYQNRPFRLATKLIHSCGLTIASSFHNIARHLAYRPTHIKHELCN